MSDYISRDELLKCQFEFYSHGTHCYEKAVYADVIKTLPAADVVEVRPGEWIEWWPGDCAVVMTGEEMLWECSRCTAKYAERSNYCPNCGAKMDGGDHDAAD